MAESEPVSTEVDQLDDAPWLKALRLWLEWNHAFEKATSRMFAGGDDHQRIEDMMDQVDRLRHEAVQLSEELIS
jgi:hypothetical protein